MEQSFELESKSVVRRLRRRSGFSFHLGSAWPGAFGIVGL